MKLTFSRMSGPFDLRECAILLDGEHAGHIESSKQINYRPAKHIDFATVNVILYDRDEEANFSAPQYDASSALRAAKAWAKAQLLPKGAKKNPVASEPVTSAYQPKWVGPVTEKDVTPAALAAKKVRIVRGICGYSKPKSGNHHQPTPQFYWHVFFKGVRQGSAASLKGAKELAAIVLEDAGRAS